MTNRTSPLIHIDRRTLITNILLLFSGSAVSQGLTALVLLLTARQIGPEQYGQYASSIVLTTFCSIFFNFGLDTWLLREGSSRPSQIGVLAGSVLGIKIGFGGVWEYVYSGKSYSIHFVFSSYFTVSRFDCLDGQLVEYFPDPLQGSITKPGFYESDCSFRSGVVSRNIGIGLAW